LTGTTTATWDATTTSGATANLRHELFRSENPADFQGATCVETLAPGTKAIDTVTPASGEVGYFLVRSANSCGLGGRPAASPRLFAVTELR